jgi:hypothetical protein
MTSLDGGGGGGSTSFASLQGSANASGYVVFNAARNLLLFALLCAQIQL